MKVYSALYNDDAHLTEVFKGGFETITSFEETKDVPGILVLHGGSDISPTLYGEKTLSVTHASKEPSKRDKIEMELIDNFVARKWPIFGICRGMQMLTAHQGGKLIQHVTNHNTGSHEMTVMQRSRVNTKTVVTYPTFEVNSAHHQMCVLNRVRDAELTGWTPSPNSGVYIGARGQSDFEVEPEAVHFQRINAYAVQWHPEWLKKDSLAVQWVLEELRTKITKV